MWRPAAALKICALNLSLSARSRKRRSSIANGDVASAMTSILQQHLGPLKLADSPVDQPTRTSPKPALSAQDIAGKWLEQFNHAIRSRDPDAVANLFREDGI